MQVSLGCKEEYYIITRVQSTIRMENKFVLSSINVDLGTNNTHQSYSLELLTYLNWSARDSAPACSGNTKTHSTLRSLKNKSKGDEMMRPS